MINCFAGLLVSNSSSSTVLHCGGYVVELPLQFVRRCTIQLRIVKFRYSIVLVYIIVSLSLYIKIKFMMPIV